jgi:hypothetical protein
MAAPPEDFRAHDRGPKSRRHHHELEQAGRELLAGNMVGVAAKGGMPPGGVRGIRGRLATASQGGKPEIVDPGGAERRFEHRPLILGLAAGAGKAPDVRDRFDSIRREDGQKIRERAGRMPHGPYDQGHAHLLAPVIVGSSDGLEIDGDDL